MENDKRITELEYPFYTTNTEQLTYKQDCRLNPYTEFMYYALEKYFPQIKRTRITMEDFFGMDKDSQIAMLTSVLSDFSNGFDISFGEQWDANKKRKYNVLHFSKDGDEICRFAERDYMEGSLSFEYANVSKRSLRVEFPDNTSFDYLLEDAKAFNVYVFNSLSVDEDKEGTNQVDMAICLVLGLMNFMDYVKFHKLNQIKINGINAYINSKEEVKDSLSIEYNYSNAFVMHIKSDGGCSLHVINYKTYVDDTDKMLEDILNRKTDDKN